MSQKNSELFISDMTLANIDAAVSFNNNGANRLIFKKDHTEAIQSLQRAVLSAEELLRSGSCQSQGHLNESNSNAGDRLQLELIDLECTGHQSIGYFPTMSDDATAAVDSLQPLYQDSFICKSVIMIYQDKSTNDEISASSHVPMVALSALFNLAIASHLYGIRHHSTPHLKKALQFYEISNTLHDSSSTSSNTRCIVLPIYNNMAMIYQSMGDEQKANEYLRRLCKEMSSLENEGRGEGEGNHQIRGDERNWRGFWSNIAGLLLSTPATAASA